MKMTMNDYTSASHFVIFLYNQPVSATLYLHKSAHFLTVFSIKTSYFEQVLLFQSLNINCTRISSVSALNSTHIFSEAFVALAKNAIVNNISSSWLVKRKNKPAPARKGI
jgi:hypothetical protein